MKSVVRILARFVAATVAVSLLLLLFNAVLFGVWTVGSHDGNDPRGLIKMTAESLKQQNGQYVLSPAARQQLDDNRVWAMLIDGGGDVVWNENLPQEIPLSYTASDIAVFSRWYLQDYPVYVWRHPDGLLVLGYPKDSYWKYPVSYPMTFLDSMGFWAPAILILNAVLAIVLSLLIGYGLVRSIRPLVRGIYDMASGKAVALKETGLLRDISASVNRTATELKRKNEALEKQNEARSNWIAGVSHDIRTPLSMILGYADELEENELLPVEEREKAAVIRRQGIGLRELVTDLNLVSMLEYDMQPLNIRPLKPAAIIRQVVSELINDGLGEQYRTEVAIGDEALSVSGDERLLKRALLNLIQNSVGHNPQGCRIGVSMAADHVSNSCVITVKDDGKGVASACLSELAKLPYTAGRGRGSHEGHGLGLPMVSRIVKAHGGQISLASDSNKGFEAVIVSPMLNLQP